jgi:hypothetical protein
MANAQARGHTWNKKGLMGVVFHTIHQSYLCNLLCSNMCGQLGVICTNLLLRLLRNLVVLAPCVNSISCPLPAEMEIYNVCCMVQCIALCSESFFAMFYCGDLQSILAATQRSFSAMKRRLGSKTATGIFYMERPFFDVDVELKASTLRAAYIVKYVELAHVAIWQLQGD